MRDESLATLFNTAAANLTEALINCGKCSDVGSHESGQLNSPHGGKGKKGGLSPDF